MPLNVSLQVSRHHVAVERLDTSNNNIQWWLMTYNFLSTSAKLFWYSRGNLKAHCFFAVSAWPVSIQEKKTTKWPAHYLPCLKLLVIKNRKSKWPAHSSSLLKKLFIKKAKTKWPRHSLYYMEILLRPSWRSQTTFKNCSFYMLTSVW